MKNIQKHFRIILIPPNVTKFLNRINGFNLFGFVFGEWIFITTKRENYSDTDSWDVSINHECIHILQYREMLYLGFLIGYFIEYLYYRMRGKKHYEAYMSISLEKEAYLNENNQAYCAERKPYAWFKYLKN